MFGPNIMPMQGMINQVIVIGVAILGSLYLYRSIESRIVAVESRVSAVESILTRIHGK
jgi:hypothetical protein